MQQRQLGLRSVKVNVEAVLVDANVVQKVEKPSFESKMRNCVIFIEEILTRYDHSDCFLHPLVRIVLRKDLLNKK